MGIRARSLDRRKIALNWRFAGLSFAAMNRRLLWYAFHPYADDVERMRALLPDGVKERQMARYVFGLGLSCLDVAPALEALRERLATVPAAPPARVMRQRLSVRRRPR
jgi:hypothetical protein